MEIVLTALRGGIASLASYLAAHVLLCLVPAFFVAGALSALVPQQAIVRFLGPSAARWVAYPAAAGAGSLLAVCSCTVQPLFAGIYKQGAGLGPAVTFLFFAPAANVLALAYTGVALGVELAVARVVLALCFGVGIGVLMALVFRRDEAAREGNAALFTGLTPIPGRTVVFLLVLLALLISGTLKVSLLTAHLATIELETSVAVSMQTVLDRWVPVDELRGAEGLSVHGVVLIGLLLLTGAVSLRGLGRVDEGFTRRTWLSIGLIVATLLFASLHVQTSGSGLELAITGRSVAVAALLVVVAFLARRFEAWDAQQWLWETWRFVRQIFPLLVGGVFVVGVLRVFIRPEWVQAIAGDNSLFANFAGVGFGIFMYFPTLVEVPVAQMFLSLGMHRGPLLAYLMADPELSLQSILITASIIGKRKAWTYVGFVALFATISGVAYGAWVDGTSALYIALLLALFIGVIVAALKLTERNRPLPSTRITRGDAP